MAELIPAYTAITSAVSLVSSIVTVVEVGRRIIARVNEFVNYNGDVPEVLADVKAQLPLLIETMDQLKSLAEERLQRTEPQSALAEAVTGFRSRVVRLEILVNKLLPQETHSRTKKVINGLKKAPQTMYHEREISDIMRKLEPYKSSFNLHFNISVHTNRVTTKEKAYYRVPCLQVSDYGERTAFLESGKSAVQQWGEQQLRQVVVVRGMGGHGKSQLAMDYCQTKEFLEGFERDKKNNLIRMPIGGA